MQTMALGGAYQHNSIKHIRKLFFPSSLEVNICIGGLWKWWLNTCEIHSTEQEEIQSTGLQTILHLKESCVTTWPMTDRNGSSVLPSHLPSESTQCHHPCKAEFLQRWTSGRSHHSYPNKPRQNLQSGSVPGSWSSGQYSYLYEMPPILVRNASSLLHMPWEINSVCVGGGKAE